MSRRSFGLAFCSTLLAAAAQILVKLGAASLHEHATLTQVLRHPSVSFRFAVSVVTNLNLFVGYALSGLNVVVLSLALKGQDLSRVYPVIALAFVWVTFFSLFFLPGEHLNVYRAAGISLMSWVSRS